MRVTITVAASRRDGVQAVAARLRAAGMEIDRVLEALGMITGTVPDERLPMLEGLDGVASVDRQEHFQLPDPGNEVQ